MELRRLAGWQPWIELTRRLESSRVFGALIRALLELKLLAGCWPRVDSTAHGLCSGPRVDSIRVVLFRMPGGVGACGRGSVHCRVVLRAGVEGVRR